MINRVLSVGKSRRCLSLGTSLRYTTYNQAKAGYYQTGIRPGYERTHKIMFNRLPLQTPKSEIPEMLNIQGASQITFGKVNYSYLFNQENDGFNGSVLASFKNEDDATKVFKSEGLDPEIKVECVSYFLGKCLILADLSNSLIESDFWQDKFERFQADVNTDFGIKEIRYGETPKSRCDVVFIFEEYLHDLKAIEKMIKHYEVANVVYQPKFALPKPDSYILKYEKLPESFDDYNEAHDFFTNQQNPRKLNFDFRLAKSVREGYLIFDDKENAESYFNDSELMDKFSFPGSFFGKTVLLSKIPNGATAEELIKECQDTLQTKAFKFELNQQICDPAATAVLKFDTFSDAGKMVKLRNLHFKGYQIGITPMRDFPEVSIRSRGARQGAQ